MVKLIPLSIVVASIAVPLILARRPTSRSLRNMVLWITVLVLVWGVLCLGVYPRFVFIE